MLLERQGVKQNKRKDFVAISLVVLIYSSIFIPWFLDVYSHQLQPDVLGNGNLAYDFINKKQLPLFSYPIESHLPGLVLFQILVIPFYKITGEFFFSLGILEFIIAILSLSIWLLICKKIDSQLITLFGICAIFMPPLFRWHFTYAWGTHPESVALQALMLLLFIRLSTNKYNSDSLTILLGLLSGLSVFFLIGNLTMVICILASWAVLDFQRFMRKSLLFLIGFAVGILPLVLYVSNYSQLGAFRSYFLLDQKGNPTFYNIKLFPTHFANALTLLIDAPLFGERARVIAYLLMTLIGYLFLIYAFINKKSEYANKKFCLLPIILYPIIFFVFTAMTSLPSEKASFVRYRYFLYLAFVFSFLLAFMINAIYKRSRSLGAIALLSMIFLNTYKEPTYEHQFRKLFNIKSSDISALKVYKGVDRYSLRVEYIPRFLASSSDLKYIDLASKYHEEELWLVCEQLARWTYLNDLSNLNKAYLFAVAQKCEDFFMRGLGFGLAEQTINDQCRNISQMSHSDEIVRYFELLFVSKSKGLNIDPENSNLRKGAVIALYMTLAGHIGCSGIAPYIKDIIFKLPMDKVSKLEALFESYIWSKWLTGYYWHEQIKCVLKRECQDLKWAYEVFEDDKAYLSAMGKLIARVYSLGAFYIHEHILSDDAIRSSVRKELAKMGLGLGESRDGFVKIVKLVK